LISPVVEALEALGNWAPPDDPGALVDDLNLLLPGIRKIVATMARDLTRVSGTLTRDTPVDATVAVVVSELANTAQMVHDDDDAADVWRVADAAAIDRHDAPRTAEWMYNVGDDPATVVAPPVGTLAAPPPAPGRREVTIGVTCQEPGCGATIYIDLPKDPDNDGEAYHAAARKVAPRHGWHNRDGWVGCPDHNGVGPDGVEHYVSRGRVLRIGVVRCSRPNCDATFSRRFVVRDGLDPDDGANRLAQFDAADAGWDIQPGYSWVGCPAHPRLNVADAVKANPGHPLAKRLAIGETSRVKLTGGAIGSTFRVTLGDGSTVIEKTVKSFDGPAAKWPAADQQDAEELVAHVGQLLGLRTPAMLRAAPDTVYMEDLPGQVALKAFRHDPAGPRLWADTDDGHLTGVLDIITDNTDRHNGNWLVDPATSRIGLIDHGFAFKQATPGRDATKAPWGLIRQWHSRDEVERPFSAPFFNPPTDGYEASTTSWKGNPIHPDDCAEIRTRLEAARPAFEAKGHADWHNFMLARFRMVELWAGGTRRIQWDNPTERSSTPWTNQTRPVEPAERPF
jgi:hypothetical protein